MPQMELSRTDALDPEFFEAYTQFSAVTFRQQESDGDEGLGSGLAG